MRSIVFGASMLALLAPAAVQAQTTRPATPPAASSTTTMEQNKFLVFFDWDRANLTPEGRRIVAAAAEEYKKTGQARITVVGHTDTSGSAAYNQRLSERRADTVKAELIRLGVPAGNIVAFGRGQNDLLVPTKDGVREPQNRRVEITWPKPAKTVAAPPPPAPTPAAAPPPPPPPPPPPQWAVSLGPWVGYSLKEVDRDTTKEAWLGGLEASVEYTPIPWLGLRLNQAGYNTWGTSQNDGWGGRSVAGVDFIIDAGIVKPYLGINGGGIYGAGVQDGFLAGPEGGVKIDLTRSAFLYAKAGYDYLFRNDQWDQGVITGGLGGGYRF